MSFLTEIIGWRPRGISALPGRAHLDEKHPALRAIEARVRRCWDPFSISQSDKLPLEYQRLSTRLFEQARTGANRVQLQVAITRYEVEIGVPVMPARAADLAERVCRLIQEFPTS